MWPFTQSRKERQFDSSKSLRFDIPNCISNRAPKEKDIEGLPHKLLWIHKESSCDHCKLPEKYIFYVLWWDSPDKKRWIKLKECDEKDS